MDTNVEQFHLPVCQSCGGEYEHISENKYKCKNCGNVHYINNPLSSPITSASIREGTILRNDGYFDKAESHFMDVIEKSSSSADLAEAYWGRFLCEYGIIHVRDKKTGVYLPTACHRIMSIPAKKDKFFLKAIEHCESQLKKDEYLKDAEYIENIRLRQIEEAKKEPYQIFISHKKTTENTGSATESYTRDYIQSGKLYRLLTGKGYKVFFADESLTKGSVGSAFEAQIFTALATSKVMIVVGSCKENLNAPYVKNEWTRFLRQQEFDHEKVIIPVLIDGMPPNQLPSELRKIEGLEMDADFNDKLLKQLEVIFKNDKSHDIKTKVIGARDAKKATKVSGVEKRSFTSGGIEAKKLLIQQERDIDVAFRYLGEHAYADAKYILTKQIEKTDDVDEIIDFGLKQISVVPKLIKADFNHALDANVFNAFNEAVKGAPDSSREIIFNYFENFALEALKVSNIEWGIKCYSTIMAWDYKGRDKFDDKVRDLAHSWLDKTTVQKLKNYTLLMKEVLKFDEGGIDNYLDGLKTCAENILAAGKKEVTIPKITIRELALAFYKDIVEHDEGDYATRWKIILFKTGTTEEKSLKNVISNFAYFQEFQVMLEFTPEWLRHDYVDKLITAVINGTKNFFTQKSNIKIEAFINLFNEAITFIGNGKDKYLRNRLYEMARVFQDAGEFLHAITYYNMIVREKPDECDAHWGLLQCKTNSRNDDELIAQKKPIHRMKEFTNAYQAAGSNEEKVNYYLEVKRKQGNHTVSISTGKRYKRNKAYGIIAIVLAILSLGVGFFALGQIVEKYSVDTKIATDMNYPMFMACAGGTLLAIILASIGLKKPAEKNKAKIIFNVVTSVFLLVSLFSSFVAYKSFIGFKIVLNHNGQVTEYLSNPYTKDITFIPVKDGKKFVGWKNESGEMVLLRGATFDDFTWADGTQLYAEWGDVTIESVTTPTEINNIVQQVNSWVLLDCSNLQEDLAVSVEVPEYVNYLKISGEQNVIDISFNLANRRAPITFEFENISVSTSSTFIQSESSAQVNLISVGSIFTYNADKIDGPIDLINVSGALNITFDDEVESEYLEDFNAAFGGAIHCNDLTISSKNGGGRVYFATQNVLAIEASNIQINCGTFICEQLSTSTDGAIIDCLSLNAEINEFAIVNSGNSQNSPVAIKAENATIKATSQIVIQAVRSFEISEKLCLEHIISEVQPVSESVQNCETGSIVCNELSLVGGNYNVSGIEQSAIKATSVNVKANKLEVVTTTNNSATNDLVSCNVFVAEVNYLIITCSNYANSAGNAICAQESVNIKIGNEATIVGGNATTSSRIGGDAIKAPIVNITGNQGAVFTAIGGNGAPGTSSMAEIGGTGGNAIRAQTITVSGLTVNLKAGNGGKGGQGVTGSYQSSVPAAKSQHNNGGQVGYTGDTGYQGHDGGKGGTGGSSGRAIIDATTLNISGNAVVYLHEGNSGAGGKGGSGGQGGRAGDGVFETYSAGARGDTGAKGSNGTTYGSARTHE